MTSTHATGQSSTTVLRLVGAKALILITRVLLRTAGFARTIRLVGRLPVMTRVPGISLKSGIDISLLLIGLVSGHFLK